MERCVNITGHQVQRTCGSGTRDLQVICEWLRRHLVLNTRTSASLCECSVQCTRTQDPGKIMDCIVMVKLSLVVQMIVLMDNIIKCQDILLLFIKEVLL